MGDGGAPRGDLTPVAAPLTPRLLRLEIVMVLAVGLGPAIIDAFVLNVHRYPGLR